MPKSLTNFNAPDTVRQRFDAICHASGRTRTSVLVELMTDYILHQSQHLATRNHQFQMVDELLGENTASKGARSFPSNQTRSSRDTTQTRSNREFDLPDFLVSDGQEGW
ncbi:MAG: hypothetical protein O9283_09075 [Sphingomonadaceae bacterium]|nr:hypothetical protein [Sphingomonadaceae bacterium]